MIDANNPEINVEKLMQEIREEVGKQNTKIRTELVSNLSINRSAFDMSHSHIEALLITAESRSTTRTKWPDKFSSFPFNLSFGLQKIVLKILNLFFKDQREVNFNLIRALKESVSLNRQLITELDNVHSQVDEHLNVIDKKLQKLDKHLNTVNEQIQTIDENFTRNNSSIRNDLAHQKNLIEIFLENPKWRFPNLLNKEQIKSLLNQEKKSLDAFYTAFENEFRGEREDILNRLKIYLPFIEGANIGQVDSPILDLGCGRGEWLELLQNSNYTARGVDINRITLEQCRSRNFEVIESDAITYLQSLPNLSLGAVTGFHLIEHLSFEELIKLLTEIQRVIKPGGIIIFETPNPENIIVGSCNFYSDPTHKKPLFPPTIKFIFEQHEFDDVQILRLNQFRIENDLELIEADHVLAPKLNPIIEIIKSRFYVAPDFAVIARKA